MVRADEVVAGEPVHVRGDPLHQAPIVGEDQRRRMLRNQIEKPHVNRRPDRRAGSVQSRELLHVVNRRDDGEIEVLPHPRIDDADRARDSVHIQAGEEASD